MSKKGFNIYHRKDGRWEGRIFIGDNKKYKSVYGKNYSAVKEKMEEFKQDIREKSVGCSKNFSEILLAWLESVKPRIKESSYQCYLRKLNLHILPYFEGKKYSGISVKNVEDFILAMLEKGLSKRYVGDMVVVLKMSAKWAERTFGYYNNIRNSHIPKQEKKEPLLLTENEQKKLINYLKNDGGKISVGILTAMFTGIRIGELCALQWRDIDFKNGLLHVRKTIQRIQVNGEKNKTAVRITPPKTDSSLRDIPISKALTEILKSKFTSENDYILSGKNTPIEPRLLTYRYKKILENSGLPSIKFHALRHTFATICLHKNFDIKTISELLGHSSADITLRTYVHTSMERKRKCMENLSMEM